MEDSSIVLIHRENGKFLKEGLKIGVYDCIENIKSFYEENGIIFLVLSLEKDFTDDEFYQIVQNICYDDFENLGVDMYPKDNEYYPTFVIEIKETFEEDIISKVHNTLNLFMQKVVKIYCNN